MMIKNDPNGLDLVYNLLRLNLKLFEDLFRYKSAFNSFQADLNTSLLTTTTTIDDTNVGQQPNIEKICEKFSMACQDLTSADYDSSIYSILAIVHDFNSQQTDCDDLNNSQNDSEVNCLSRQIQSFLNLTRQDRGQLVRLFEQLLKRMTSLEETIEKTDLTGLNEMETSNVSNRFLVKFQCKFCLIVFDQTHELISHLIEQHESKFDCARCGRSFQSSYVLTIHLRKTDCGLDGFNSDSSLLVDDIASVVECDLSMDEDHVKQNLLEVEQIQTIVANKQPGSTATINHFVLDSDERKFLCGWPGCGKTFTRCSYLSNHMMAHSEERNYVCGWPGCSKRYKTQAHLLNHSLWHKQEGLLLPNTLRLIKRFRCSWPKCGRLFESEPEMITHLDGHKRIEHLKEQQNSKLEKNQGKVANANKASVSNSLLSKKLYDGVENQQQYLCEFPGCRFVCQNPGELQIHVSVKHRPTLNAINNNTTPPGTDSFQCHYCGICFRKKSSLSNHVKSHSGQFDCLWPGCSFRTNSSLTLERHNEAHKDYSITTVASNQHGGVDGRFTCKQCGKTFQKRASIINHIRSHSGTFICKTNGCGFSSHSKLLYRRHLAQGHDDLNLEPAKKANQSFPQKSITVATPASLSSNQRSLKSSSSKISSQNVKVEPESDENETFDNQSAVQIKREEPDFSSLIINHNDHPNKEDGVSNSSVDALASTSSADQKKSSLIRIFHCRFPGCTYQTPKRPLYRVHMLKHSEVRRHRCSWFGCSKAFKAKSTLNRHLYRHRQLSAAASGQELIKTNQNTNNSMNDGVKNAVQQFLDDSNSDWKAKIKFKCDVCDRLFRTKSSLSNHIISHDKPQYKCDYAGCFYETFRLSILQRHQKGTHSMNNNNSSTSKSDLQKSLPYRCGKANCIKSFDSWDNLHWHISSAHPQANVTNNNNEKKRFACSWSGCQYSSDMSSNLRKHVERHRKKQQQEQRLQQQEFGSTNVHETSQRTETTINKNKFAEVRTYSKLAQPTKIIYITGDGGGNKKN